MNRLQNALALMCLLMCCAVGAQPFPTKPVRLIVPYAAGGEIDAISRFLSRKLEEKWHQPVVVDNRAGGGSVIGTELAARAEPDGYTLLIHSFGYVTNPFLMHNLPYDSAAFTPLIRLATAPNILYVTSAVPGSTLQDVIAYAKAHPGELSFASTGNGSSPHIVAEMFAAMSGTTMTHVPYKGTAPAVTDLLGGHVKAIFGLYSLMPNTRDGKLRPIAVASETHLIGAPQIPTTAEAGLPGLLSASWYGLFVGAKVPDPVKRKLYADLREIADAPDTRKFLVQLGLEPATQDSDQFAAFLRAESEKWGGVIRARHITLD